MLDLGDLELAKALGAVECGNGEVSVRVLGLLLFCRTDALASMLPAHEVAFQVLSGTAVEVNDFLRWPLLRVMEDNLLVTGPRPRNPLLADAFKRAGIVERTARGIDTIFHEQLRNGRPAPSYERSTEAGVTLVLPGGEPNLGFVRLAVEEGRQGRPLSPDELLLLNALEREPRLTILRAAATIQKGDGDAEAVLRKLCERGIVKARGAAPRQTFRLSEAAGQRIGDRKDAGEGRTASARHDERVCRYVDEHGLISRKEAAELCAIDAPRAYRLLKKMERDGVLRRVGAAGRGARYERNA